VSLAHAADTVPFSHKRHAPLKIECSFCHAGAASGERAGFPPASQCMVCHRAVKQDSPEIRALAALPKDARIAPADPVYKLPDFVFFSHARHGAAKVECQSCHGDIWQQDQIKAAVAIKMRFCVDCHRARKASVACNICHELNQ
jgi:hypothetical protein